MNYTRGHMSIPSPDFRISNPEETLFQENILILESYFASFESLSLEKNWPCIIDSGTKAINAAKATNRYSDRARIHLQMAFAYFHQENYPQLLKHIDRYRTLACFLEAKLLIYSLYLESITFHAMGKKEVSPNAQVDLFKRSQNKAQEALKAYQTKNLSDPMLLGSINAHFGMIEESLPHGSIELAISYYQEAYAIFQKSENDRQEAKNAAQDAKIRIAQAHIKIMPNVLANLLVQSQEKSSAKPNRLEQVKAHVTIAMKDNDPILKILKSTLITPQSPKEQRRMQVLKKLFKKERSPQTSPPTSPK